MPRTKPEIAIQGLARLARRTGSGEMTPAQHARGRERLIGAVDRAETPEPRRLRWALLAAAAALAIAVVIWARWPAPSLAYTIDGAVSGQSYLQAGPNGASARFSEGTVIALAPGARGRVAAVGPRGARFAVEAGSARFDVAHRPGAAWVAEAGPFTVEVKGTSFDLAWSGARIEIVMHAGSVRVHGPPVPEGLALHAGQRLVADAARAEVSLVSGPPAPSAAPTAVTSSAPPPPIARTPAREVPPSLRARVAAGDFAGVIADAEARGIDAAIDESSLADLAALADAARYAGRADLARRALAAERTRFPGSPEARSAAFLLGRMAEGSSPAAAITWYDLYLAESPAGSLAAEALGRKMLAMKALSGPATARPVAEEYRRRFPDGPHAAAAAAILEEP